MRIKNASAEWYTRWRLWAYGGGIIVAIGVAVALTLYANNTDDHIDRVAASLQRAEHDANALIKENNAKREAEAQRAAHEIADQARTTNGTESGTIDSTKCNAAKSHNIPSSIDVLVNKKHCIQPVTFEPTDLVISNGATLSKKAVDAFNRMFADAAAAGQGFYVTSSYRSYVDQVNTYAYWVGVSGREGADTYSARPGYSEHQTGFVIDVAANGCALDCFGTTSQYQWLQQHAADYGFIQRYYAGSEAITGYKAEEWHYRYVGEQAANDMKAKGIKTLEQYWSIAGGDYQ